MVKCGLIEPLELYERRWGRVFKLSTEGVLLLRRYRMGNFKRPPDVSPHHVPHELSVVDVYLALQESGSRFDWMPVFESRFDFEALRRPKSYGMLERVGARLVPDAVITPHEPEHPRIFLELDRGTHSVRERDYKVTIRSKLSIYEAFFYQQDRAYGRTWYQSAFGDGRPPLIVFVLTKQDPKRRRERSILRAAKRMMRDASKLKIIYLQDLLVMSGVFPTESETCEVSFHEIETLSCALRALERRAVLDPALRMHAGRMRLIVSRLSSSVGL
jgi:hypothetical protein